MNSNLDTQNQQLHEEVTKQRKLVAEAQSEMLATRGSHQDEVNDLRQQLMETRFEHEQGVC